MARPDELGNKIKALESLEAGRTLMPYLPIVARLDGKAFHTFTKGLEFPIDMRLRDAMSETTKYLVSEFQAAIGYTQSDEISLVFLAPTYPKDRLFDGRIQKLCSILAAKASVKFNLEIATRLPLKAKETPVFDARVFNAPSLEFAADTLMWRELDATKNSISMAARAFYSQKEVNGKKSAELHEMLRAKGVNWNDYPSFFKKGSYFKKINVVKTLDPSVLVKIPVKHRPTDPVYRSVISELDIPPLSKLENAADVLFKGRSPILKSV